MPFRPRPNCLLGPSAVNLLFRLGRSWPLWSRRDRSGFTLLEILLAVFIFGTVLSIIYTSYTGTFRIVSETENQADIYRMARIALERISEDLASVYVSGEEETPEDAGSSESGESPPLFQFVGATRQIEERRADTLRFTSLAHLVFSERDQPGRIARIGYSVEQGDTEEGLVLIRSDDAGLGLTLDPEERVGGLVLCDQLHSVGFTYYNRDGDKSEDWDSEGEEFNNAIPVMVSIELEFVNKFNPEGPYKFMTSVALPMLALGEEE